MAFVTKTWKDRLVEFAGRRKLKNVSTNEEVLYDVSRSEGTVMQAGDSFNATNMNDLEQRIKTEFDNVNSSFADLKKSVADGKTLIASAITNKGVTTNEDATFSQMATNIETIKTSSSDRLVISSETISNGTPRDFCTLTIYRDGVSVYSMFFNALPNSRLARSVTF